MIYKVPKYEWTESGRISALSFYSDLFMQWFDAANLAVCNKTDQSAVVVQIRSQKTDWVCISIKCFILRARCRYSVSAVCRVGRWDAADRRSIGPSTAAGPAKRTRRRRPTRPWQFCPRRRRFTDHSQPGLRPCATTWYPGSSLKRNILVLSFDVNREDKWKIIDTLAE